MSKKKTRKKKTNRKTKNKNVFPKKIIIFFIVIIILSALAITGYWFYKNYKFTFKVKESVTVLVGEPVDPKAYIIKKENCSVTYNIVDTSVVGDTKIKYIVTDKFKKKHVYYLTLTVKDNEAPVISVKDSVTIYKDAKFDVNSFVKATDNVDKEIKISYDGNIDTSKVGTYKIDVIAEDLSGNKSTKNISVIVKEKPIYEPLTIENGTVGTTSKGYKIENKNGATYINGILIANKSYPVSSNYGKGLTGDTSSAFNEMKNAAALAGIDIYIGSGYRSYNTQKSIYNSYVKRDGRSAADTYSARPGYSEHQTGLAVDICSHNEYKACVNSNFNHTATAKWLHDNAHYYGFILRYPNGKSGETGYKYESWHFRYVGKELATTLYNNGDWITLESYLGINSKYSN